MSGKRLRRMLFVAGGSAALVAVAAAPLSPRLRYDPEALEDACLAPDYLGVGCFPPPAVPDDDARLSASAALLPGESGEPVAVPARETIRLRYETAGLAELDAGATYLEPRGGGGRQQAGPDQPQATEMSETSIRSTSRRSGRPG